MQPLEVKVTDPHTGAKRIFIVNGRISVSIVSSLPTAHSTMKQPSAALYTNDALRSSVPSPPLSDILERNLEFEGFHDCTCRVCGKCMTYAALGADLASYVQAIREREGQLRDLYAGASRRGRVAQCQYNAEHLKQEIRQLHDEFMTLQLAHAEIEICSRKPSDSSHPSNYNGSLNGRDDSGFDDDKDDSTCVEWKEGHSSDMDLGSSESSSIANSSDEDMVFSSCEVDEVMYDSYSDDKGDSESRVSLFAMYVGPFVGDVQQEAPILRPTIPQSVSQRSQASSSQSHSLWCYHEETALEEIRRKMRQARASGETETRTKIKHLVTEAHNTPAYLRTEVQKVLLTEWRSQRNPSRPRIFRVRTHEVYVDASRSGIGFYFEDQWQAWVLNPSWWNVKRCDIQWAEAVAVELGLRLLIAAGLSACKIKLHSDNLRVVDAIHSDEIYEMHIGEIIYYINFLCRAHNIDCSIEWISGSQNPADGPSRLLMRDEIDEHQRFPYDIDIPDRLRNLVFPYRLPKY